MAEGETTEEAVSRIVKAAGGAPIVCILGSTSFNDADSEALVKALAEKLTATMDEAILVTGGMAGVQQVFAESCGDGARVWNLLPVGQASGYLRGLDIHAGADLEQRKAIMGQLGDIYVTVEGGPGVSAEARAAHARGAGVLPMARTGGASSGMFDFPEAALKRPPCAGETEWALLFHPYAPAAQSAAAAAAIVAQMASAPDSRCFTKPRGNEAPTSPPRSQRSLASEKAEAKPQPAGCEDAPTATIAGSSPKKVPATPKWAELAQAPFFNCLSRDLFVNQYEHYDIMTCHVFQAWFWEKTNSTR